MFLKKNTDRSGNEIATSENGFAIGLLIAMLIFIAIVLTGCNTYIARKDFNTNRFESDSIFVVTKKYKAKKGYFYIYEKEFPWNETHTLYYQHNIAYIGDTLSMKDFGRKYTIIKRKK